MLKDKKFSVLTLGCKVNQYESEAIIEQFQEKGNILANNNEVSDIYIVNTCTVTNLSDRKSRQYIRKAKRDNPQSIIVVVGCYAQTSPDEVSKIPGVDIIVGTSEKDRILELCEKFLNDKTQINKVKDIKNIYTFENMDINKQESMTRAYMKVQDGCNQYCTYCIIPYARGNIRSREIESALKEADRLSKAGYKEIVLTGIHIGSYGKDLGNKRLIDLIEAISEIEGIERIRLSSIEPNIIDENFMKRIVSTKKVCDHFHLSLQNGSDKILKSMNRKYTSDQFFEKTQIIKEYMPNVGLTTDVIVGFPGEENSDFNSTCEFVEKIKFSKIHVFKYSPRKGTPAAKMKNQVPGELKISRSQKLIEISNKLAENFIIENYDRELSVLFEKELNGNNIYEGYSTNYIRIQVYSEEDLKNTVKNVKIISNKSEIAKSILI